MGERIKEWEQATLEILKFYAEYRTASLSTVVSLLADLIDEAYTSGRIHRQHWLYGTILASLKSHPGPAAPDLADPDIAKFPSGPKGRAPSWSNLDGFGMCARDEWNIIAGVVQQTGMVRAAEIGKA